MIRKLPNYPVKLLQRFAIFEVVLEKADLGHPRAKT